jgi:hypothetical protein
MFSFITLLCQNEPLAVQSFRSQHSLSHSGIILRVSLMASKRPRMRFCLQEPAIGHFHETFSPHTPIAFSFSSRFLSIPFFHTRLGLFPVGQLLLPRVYAMSLVHTLIDHSWRRFFSRCSFFFSISSHFLPLGLYVFSKSFPQIHSDCFLSWQLLWDNFVCFNPYIFKPV